MRSSKDAPPFSERNVSHRPDGADKIRVLRISYDADNLPNGRSFPFFISLGNALAERVLLLENSAVQMRHLPTSEPEPRSGGERYGWTGGGGLGCRQSKSSGETGHP